MTLRAKLIAQSVMNAWNGGGFGDKYFESPEGQRLIAAADAVLKQPMYYRFKVTDGTEITFTPWAEEPDDVAGSNAQRVAIVSRIRAAQPDSAIATERVQAIPKDDTPTTE